MNLDHTQRYGPLSRWSVRWCCGRMQQVSKRARRQWCPTWGLQVRCEGHAGRGAVGDRSSDGGETRGLVQARLPKTRPVRRPHRLSGVSSSVAGRKSAGDCAVARRGLGSVLAVVRAGAEGSSSVQTPQEPWPFRARSSVRLRRVATLAGVWAQIEA